MKTEPKHVYDWLDEPALNPAEADAKKWLNEFCKPAHKKPERWLKRFQVSCEWRGQRWICSGASRMGDVWLKKKESRDFYDERVLVEECSKWKRIVLPTQEKGGAE